MWTKFPLKGSKEYKALVTFTGLAIGLVWIARDEYENPKWTAIPKASALSVNDLNDWNKQFGPKDSTKWAISMTENDRILKALDETGISPDATPPDVIPKKETW
jgi:hypothetical protein